VKKWYGVFCEIFSDAKLSLFTVIQHNVMISYLNLYNLFPNNIFLFIFFNLNQYVKGYSGAVRMKNMMYEKCRRKINV